MSILNGFDCSKRLFTQICWNFGGPLGRNMTKTHLMNKKLRLDQMMLLKKSKTPS